MHGNQRRVYVLYGLFALCTLLYYAGELVNFAGWRSLQWAFFYTVHDVHRLFFLVPIVYAGYFFGVRAAIIATLVASGVFLPRALFVSPFPDPLLRTVLFIIIAGAVGWVTGWQSEQRRRLSARVKSQIDSFLGILERMPAGVLVIGPDYRIRFASPSMVREFGEGVDSRCYEYLHISDEPCRQTCRLPDVIGGKILSWEYAFPDGRTCEVMASPFTDADGTSCLLSLWTALPGTGQESR